MSDFNPYAAPQSEVETERGQGVWRDGRFVVHRIDTPWPDRCYCCNQVVDRKGEFGRRSVYKLYWIHPGLLLIVFIALLILPLGLLLYFLWRKQVAIDHALCSYHWWSRFLLGALAVVLLISSWVIPIWLLRNGVDGAAPGWFEVGGFLSALLLVLGRSWRFSLRIRRIRDGLVWVRGAGRPFLDSLPILDRATDDGGGGARPAA